jgi:hypothetical protein
MYEWNLRDLRKIIVVILKSWLAKEVNKINYVQNFGSLDKNIEKREVKILFINTDNEDKLLDFISKNFSQLRRMSIW